MKGRGAALSSRLLPVLLLPLLLLNSHLSLADWHSDEQAIMGTAVSVTLWHDEPSIAKQAIDAVMSEMRRIDSSFSPYKADSELSRVNREAAKGPVSISAELASIIDKALYYSRISEGAFDISFASVGRHYDYRREQQPSESQRRALLSAIDYRLIELNRGEASIRFKHPQLQIDLGGIAKGYAVDRTIAILEALGVQHATVSAGGDSRVLGDKRGQPWMVGIKNPRGQALDRERAAQQEPQVAIRLPLEDTAISTSGDYERFFIDPTSGERIHHILNPRTASSATGVASVSILGARSFDTDPLSTTVFVLGVEKGLALVDRLPGFDAIIIDSAGRVHYSANLAPPASPKSLQ